MAHDSREEARRIRKAIIEMVYRSGASHVGTSLSCVDIMTAIYAVASISPERVADPSRDRVILSKGHGAATLYATLAERGFFSKDLLSSYYADGSPLLGHPDMHCVPGVETTTGSLGHGLPVGLGMALAARLDGLDYRVFVVLGDGECNEGSVWEGALAAGQFGLGNLTVIVDVNGQQGMGKTSEIMNMEPLSAKWAAFGWRTVEVDGHDHSELARALGGRTGRAPTAILARTVKGKGVGYMEDQLLWHYRNPNADQYAEALRELDAEPEDPKAS